jgi:esterase/lipase superfamily enzyme|eukprot:g1573.t1
MLNRILADIDNDAQTEILEDALEGTEQGMQDVLLTPKLGRRAYHNISQGAKTVGEVAKQKNVNMSQISSRADGREKMPGIKKLHDNTYAWFHTSVEELDDFVVRVAYKKQLRESGGPYMWLPFMYASRNGAPGTVIARLIEYFPHCIRVLDKDGWLPVHYAAFSGNADALPVLLEVCPLSAYARNKRGSTPMSLAKEQQKWTCVKVLKAHLESQEAQRVRNDIMYTRWYGLARPHQDKYRNTSGKFLLPWWAPSKSIGGYILEMFYCTNRSPGELKSEHYRNGRNKILGSETLFLHHGHMQVFVPIRKRKPESISWQSQGKIVPLCESQETEPLFAKTFLGEYRDWNGVGMGDLKNAAGHDRSILLFVHGYDTTFSEAALILAQFADDMNFDGVCCFFSWPSLGDAKGYTVDEAASGSCETVLADYMVDLMEVLDMGVVEYRGRKPSTRPKLHVLAHSMGARPAVGALHTAIQRSKKLSSRRLGSVIMTVPDVDIDTFNWKIQAVNGIAEKITLYNSSRDQILLLSEEIHGYPRIGSQPTGSVRVVCGDVICCGKYYNEFVPCAPSHHKYSLVGSSGTENRIRAEILDLLT